MTRLHTLGTHPGVSAQRSRTIQPRNGRNEPEPTAYPLHTCAHKYTYRYTYSPAIYLCIYICVYVDIHACGCISQKKLAESGLKATVFLGLLHPCPIRPLKKNRRGPCTLNTEYSRQLVCSRLIQPGNPSCKAWSAKNCAVNQLPKM